MSAARSVEGKRARALAAQRELSGRRLRRGLLDVRHRHLSNCMLSDGNAVR